MKELKRKRWKDITVDINRLPIINFNSIISPEQTKCIDLDPDIIKGIYVNEAKRIVVVRFSDGSVEKVKCCEEDDFDVTVGASIAICRYIFGSHTAFYRKVIGKKVINTNNAKKEEK